MALSYDLRTAVEAGNAELTPNRFKFVRGSIRVKGITTFSILMAFIVAAADELGTNRPHHATLGRNNPRPGLLNGGYVNPMGDLV